MKDRKRVLVVDDEPSIAELIEAILVDKSYDVRTTCQPREVIELAHKFRPDVAMPEDLDDKPGGPVQ